MTGVGKDREDLWNIRCANWPSLVGYQHCKWIFNLMYPSTYPEHSYFEKKERKKV